MGHHGEGTALSANSVSADRKARSSLCSPVSPVASRVARLLPASAGLASACLLVDSVTGQGRSGAGERGTSEFRGSPAGTCVRSGCGRDRTLLADAVEFVQAVAQPA